MNIKPTIIALILALLAAMAVLRTGWRMPPVSQQHQAVRRDFSAAQLPVEELTKITVKRADGLVMVFERTGAVWSQTQPFACPMDPFSIRQIAILARELDVQDTINPAALRAGRSLSTLSLDPPAAVVDYEWPGGKQSIELGRRSVAGRAYLHIGGAEDILVVNQQLHERILDMDPKEWRDGAIFRDVGVDSDTIEWEQGNLRLVLSRDRKLWRMMEPAATRIDQESHDAYLQDLGRAIVGGFILDQPSPEDLAKFGLGDPVAVLTVTTGKITQRLLIGSRAGANTNDRFGLIEGRPTVVKISGAVLGALFRQPQTLAAHTASGVQPADVKTIVIRNPSGEVKLERDLEKWSAPDRGGAIVNSSNVQELLDQLTQLRAPAVDLRPYPRDQEVGTVTFYNFAGKAVDTVRIAQEKDTGRWILENGDDVLRIFPPGMKIRMTPADFGL